MIKEREEIKNLKLFTRIKRKIVRFFLSQGSCSEDCEYCVFCPWIDKEKYSFEIKRRTED